MLTPPQPPPLRLRTGFMASRVVGDGIPLNLGTSQLVGITVDNYSNQWLQIGELFIPPFIRGWGDNLFMGSASSIQVRRITPPGIAFEPNLADGLISIGVYETPIVPSPGQGIQNQSQDPTLYQLKGLGGGLPNTPNEISIAAQFAGGSPPIPFSYDLPSFWAGDQYNEDTQIVPAHQLVFVDAGIIAVLAGVQKLLYTVPVSGQYSAGRLMFLDLSLSVATDVIVSNPNIIFGSGNVAAATLQAGIVHRFDYRPNGYRMESGTPAGSLQVKCTLACNVYFTVGFATA